MTDLGFGGRQTRLTEDVVDRVEARHDSQEEHVPPQRLTMSDKEEGDDQADCDQNGHNRQPISARPPPVVASFFRVSLEPRRGLNESPRMGWRAAPFETKRVAADVDVWIGLTYRVMRKHTPTMIAVILEAVMSKPQKMSTAPNKDCGIPSSASGVSSCFSISWHKLEKPKAQTHAAEVSCGECNGSDPAGHHGNSTFARVEADGLDLGAGAAAGRRVRKFVDSDNEHLCRRGIIQTA
jgi:hypothetical protein